MQKEEDFVWVILGCLRTEFLQNLEILRKIENDHVWCDYQWKKNCKNVMRGIELAVKTVRGHSKTTLT